MAYIGNSPANVGNYQIVDTTAWVQAAADAVELQENP